MIFLDFSRSGMQIEGGQNMVSTPTQKFQEKLKNPKKFLKPQNLGLKCMNA